jgi:hypothetical protein
VSVPSTAAAVTAMALAASGCASLVSRPPPPEPSGREGWLAYRVVDLRVEAPAAWKASGAERSLRLEDPGGRARLEVSAREEPYADAKICLAEGEGALRRGEASLERVRRHPSTLAGLPAVAQEADQGAWHGWAWAACDGGVQYRVFFTAVNTAPPEVLEVHRALLGARLGGGA